ncbi:MAG: NHLP leader peptide family RiPP precursor [Gemmatimonadota bacterium]
MRSRTQAMRVHAKIVAKAWADPAFKKRLKADPHAVLGEYGIRIPKDVRIRVVENTAKTLYVVLPAKPAAPRPGTRKGATKRTTPQDALLTIICTTT